MLGSCGYEPRAAGFGGAMSVATSINYSPDFTHLLRHKSKRTYLQRGNSFYPVAHEQKNMDNKNLSIEMVINIGAAHLYLAYQMGK